MYIIFFITERFLIFFYKNIDKYFHLLNNANHFLVNDFYSKSLKVGLGKERIEFNDNT